MTTALQRLQSQLLNNPHSMTVVVTRKDLEELLNLVKLIDHQREAQLKTVTEQVYMAKDVQDMQTRQILRHEDEDVTISRLEKDVDRIDELAKKLKATHDRVADLYLLVMLALVGIASLYHLNEKYNFIALPLAKRVS